MYNHLPPLDVAGQTDVGLKRQRNEDYFKILVPPSGLPQETRGALLIVADGIGGMGGGDVASKAAVEEVIRQYYDLDSGVADLSGWLQTSLEAANSYVRELATHVGLPRIGATMAGLALTPSGEATVFNVGDSRVYRVRSNYIEQLSRDQSIMAEQIESGQISEEDAKKARNSNVTAFIGQPTPITPVYHRTGTQKGDIFVICSDGLWSLVEPNEILSILRNKRAERAARRLVQLVRKRGAPDNVTVIVARVGAASGWFWWTKLIATMSLLVLLGIIGVLAASPGGFLAGLLSPTKTITVSPLSTADKITETIQAGFAVLSPTPTLTQTPTSTLTATTPSPSMTSSASPTLSPTSTPSSTPSPTSTVTPTPTMTLEPSNTQLPSPTGSFTPLVPTVTLGLTSIRLLTPFTNTPIPRPRTVTPSAATTRPTEMTRTQPIGG